MNDATSRAIVFALVIIACLVVIYDIRKQGLKEMQSQQVEVYQPKPSSLAVSELEEN